MTRDVYIDTARVLIAESRARGRTPFAHTLLRWAANAPSLIRPHLPHLSAHDFGQI